MMLLLSNSASFSDKDSILTSTDQPLWLIIVGGIIIALIGGLAIITIIKELLWPTDRVAAQLEKTASATRTFLEWARDNEPDDVTMAQGEFGIALQALGEYQMSRDPTQGGVTLTEAQNSISEALAAFQKMHATTEIARMQKHLRQINTLMLQSGRSGGT